MLSFHLESIKDKNKDNEDIKHYIDSIEDDIVENLEAFKEVEEDDDENNPLALFAASQHNPETFFERYRINLFVDNSEAKELLLYLNPIQLTIIWLVV